MDFQKTKMSKTVHPARVLVRFLMERLVCTLGLRGFDQELEPLTVTVQAYPRFLTHPSVKVRLLGRLLGNVKAFTDDTNFKTPTSIYAFKCPKGAWILDYKHGFSPNEHMQCPKLLGKSKCPCDN